MITEWMVGALLSVALVTVPGAAADTVRQDAPLPLAEVLESALRTHPMLAGAEARLESATATAGEARAARLPTVAASALATRYQEPMVVAPLHGFDIRTPPEFDRTLYQGHASAEYTLFDGGARSARIRASESLATAAAEGVASTRDAVLADATTAYLSALTARAVVRAHDQRVRALAEELERSRLLYEEGSTARLAVLRTEAALSRARAEREAAAEGLRLALRRLARVSGLDAGRIRQAALVEVAVVDTALPDREALLEQALARNPALAQATTRVSAAELTVDGARSSYIPNVSLSGRYSAFAAPSADLTGEWQAGVQVSYPLFTGGARGTAVERAEAEVRAARAERRLVEQRVADAVDAALLAYRSARSRVAALEAAVAQSAEVARIEALALASGAGVQTDYLRAEAELLEARAGLAEARNAVAEARVRLSRAMGELTVEGLAQMTEEVEQ